MRRGNSIESFILALLLGVPFVLGSAASVAAQPIPGLYVGELDLNPLGVPFEEPFTLNLDSSGTATMVTFLEPTERETTLIGRYERRRGGRIKIALLGHRRGVNSICDLIVAPDGSASDDCVMRMGFDLGRTMGGGLEGEIVLTAQEVDAITGETLRASLPALPVSFKRERIDGFAFP